MATYYVDSAHGSASDSNAGTSESAPWSTVTKACATLTAGDTCYVKGDGTLYHENTTPAASDNAPVYSPTNQGSAGNPIAFRAYTPTDGSRRHRPILSCNRRTGVSGDPKCPVFGSNGKDYVIWDGFAVPIGGASGTAHSGYSANFVAGADNCTVENCYLDGGGVHFQSGNYCGVWINNSDGVTVQDNIIKNYFDLANSGSALNCGGVIQFDSNNLLIRRNTIIGCGTGIYDKRNSLNNIIEYNFIVNCNVAGIEVAGFTNAACTPCDVTGSRYRFNVVASSTSGVILPGTPAGDQTIEDIQIYNNVFYSISGQGIYGRYAHPSVKIYNNIFAMLSGGKAQVWGAFTPFQPPDDLISDYNVYYQISGSLTFDPSEGGGSGGSETFAQWQSASRPDHTVGYDAASQATNPSLVGTVLSTPPNVHAYKLPIGSALRTAGRAGGVSGGASQAVGAWLDDNTQVGALPDARNIVMGYRS